MRLLFAADALRELRRLAADRVLLGFDFDGTLAPIVARPRDAALRPSTRRLLHEVARLYPCVVISGRERADLARRLKGIGLRELVGNHGLQIGAVESDARKLVAHWRQQLEIQLDPHAGIMLEDKGATLAVHYRNASRPANARRAILAAVAALPAARVLKGKMVVDLLPEGAPNKGRALQSQREQAGCRAALYVGDDRTDEDVFALTGSEPVLGIRVGRRRDSRATYYLRRQDEIDQLLSTLIEARVANQGAATRPSHGLPFRARR